ncbi:hypothetical protein MXD59_16415 [Frankia sp. Ag45/Mut15]|uniref:DUF5642 domain-containing protein n=1 Tax=Frankia umida TaxID=573489 RepID=A0ABT0K0M3_9ACTN|nr:hypothetical protein [Frankia umida]MCK9877339.1 hypothetical protein [Frankia umida]
MAAGVLAGCGDPAKTLVNRRLASGSPVATATRAAPVLHAADYLVAAGPATSGLVVDTSGAGENAPDSPEADAQLAACLGVPVAQLTSPATDRAESPVFRTADSTTVINSAAEIRPPAQVRSYAAILTRPQATRCFGRILAPVLAQAMTKGAGSGATTTVQSVQAAPALTGATAGIRMAFELTINAVRVPATVDVVFVVSGRVIATLFFGQVDGTPEPGREQAIVSQVAARLARQ